jgi:hypothetical protein
MATDEQTYERCEWIYRHHGNRFASDGTVLATTNNDRNGSNNRASPDLEQFWLTVASLVVGTPQNTIPRILSSDGISNPRRRKESIRTKSLLHSRDP